MPNTRYSCQIIKKLELYRQIFEKYWNIKFHENQCAQSVDVYATSCIPPRPLARGMQVGVMHPTTILDAPTKGLQNIEDKQADESAKKLRPCTAFTFCLYCAAVVGNILFSKKIYVYAWCFVPGYGEPYVIKMLILWSSRRLFLRLGIHNNTYILIV